MKKSLITLILITLVTGYLKAQVKTPAKQKYEVYNVTDSVKKYSDISQYYYLYGQLINRFADSTTIDWLIFYSKKFQFYQAKMDSTYSQQRKLDLENKYHIKLP